MRPRENRGEKSRLSVELEHGKVGMVTYAVSTPNFLKAYCL